MPGSLWARLEPYLDREYLLRTLFRLIETPTEVPLGPETLIDADHPKLVHYVQQVVRPELTSIGQYQVIEAPHNQLVVQVGQGTSDDSLLIMAYTPTQHHNLMRDPFQPRLAMGTAYGVDEPCVFGQGVSQNKVHQAAMLTVLRALGASGIELRGRLYFAINNEGRSSHSCSDAILDSLPRQPRFGLILIGTDMAISAGNRGRVDIYVQVRGKAAHSSVPGLGLNAIEGAWEAISRTSRLDVGGHHPLLGGRHLVPYQVTYSPLAPHTLPGEAKITYDRRLLPGDDPDEATEQVRAAIGDLSPFEVRVERGVYMLPALVDPGTELITRLSAANEAIRGIEPSICYGQGSFDAGGPCARGVPTVMWGASGGDELLGDDFVALRSAWEEVRVLAYMLLDYLA